MGLRLELSGGDPEREGPNLGGETLPIMTARCPDTSFHEPDTATSGPAGAFDVVMCLSSAVGYIAMP